MATRHTAAFGSKRRAAAPSAARRGTAAAATASNKRRKRQSTSVATRRRAAANDDDASDNEDATAEAEADADADADGDGDADDDGADRASANGNAIDDNDDDDEEDDDARSGAAGDGAARTAASPPDAQTADIATQLTALRAVASAELASPHRRADYSSPHRNRARLSFGSTTTVLHANAATGDDGAPAHAATLADGGSPQSGALSASQYSSATGLSSAASQSPNSSQANRLSAKPLTPPRAGAGGFGGLLPVTPPKRPIATGAAIASGGKVHRSGGAGRRTAVAAALLGGGDDERPAERGVTAAAARLTGATAAIGDGNGESGLVPPPHRRRSGGPHTLNPRRSSLESGRRAAAAIAAAAPPTRPQVNGAADDLVVSSDVYDDDGGAPTERSQRRSSRSALMTDDGSDSDSDSADVLHTRKSPLKAKAEPGDASAAAAALAAATAAIVPAVVERKSGQKRAIKPNIRKDPSTEPTHLRPTKADVRAYAAIASAHAATSATLTSTTAAHTGTPSSAVAPGSPPMAGLGGAAHPSLQRSPGSSPRKAGRPKGSISSRRRLALQREAEERAALQAPANAPATPGHDRRRRGAAVAAPRLAPFLSLLSPERVQPTVSFLRRRLQTTVKSEAKSGLKVEASTSTDTATEQHQRMQHYLQSKGFRRWCAYDWLYSALDRPWFEQNEFVECLATIAHTQNEHSTLLLSPAQPLLPHTHVSTLFGADGQPPERLTRKQWSRLRSKLGKPRRSSPAFFAEERAKLERARQEWRSMQWTWATRHATYGTGTATGGAGGGGNSRGGGGGGVSAAFAAYPPDAPALGSNGQTVTAIHPDTRELHAGTIIGFVPIAVDPLGTQPPATRASTDSADAGPPRTPPQRSRSLVAAEAAVAAASAAGVAGQPFMIYYRVQFACEKLGIALVPDTDVMFQPHPPPPVPHWTALKPQLLRPASASAPPGGSTNGTTADDDEELARALERHREHQLQLQQPPQPTGTAAGVAAAFSEAAGGGGGEFGVAEGEHAVVPAPFPRDDHDVTLIADLLRLLDRKKALIDLLKLMNESASKWLTTAKAAAARAPAPASVAAFELGDLVPQAFKQKYAWVILQLDTTTTHLDQFLAHLKHKRAGAAAHAALLQVPMPRRARAKSAATKLEDGVATGGATDMFYDAEPHAAVHHPQHQLRAVPRAGPLEIGAACRVQARHLVDDIREQLSADGEIPRTSGLVDSKHAVTHTSASILALISSAIALVLNVQYAVENGLDPASAPSVFADLDAALDTLRPASPANQRYFDSIRESIAIVRTSLLPPPLPERR